MTIFDSQFSFTEVTLAAAPPGLGNTAGQAITTTANSLHIIDLVAIKAGGLAFDIAQGNDVPILIQVTTAFAPTSVATLTVSLQTDTTAAFGAADTLWTTAALLGSVMVAGYRFPPFGSNDLFEGMALKRFLRLVFTVASGPFTAGRITAGITAGRQTPARSVF